MPFFFNNTNKLAVKVGELVPKYYSLSALRQTIYRNKKDAIGIKQLQRACFGKEMLIDFDTLPLHIRENMIDPRKSPSALMRWYCKDITAKDRYAAYTDDGKYLTEALQAKYTLNASVLQAVNSWRLEHIREVEEKGRKVKKIYEKMAREVRIFKEILLKKDGEKCTLPDSERRFKILFDNFFTENGVNYEYLISDNVGNSNAGKVKLTQQEALLRRLCGHGNNFDYEQIKMMYNEISARNGWRPISRSKVELFAKENKPLTESSRRGTQQFDNNIAMQHKRRATGYPMLWWSIDGWDVELLYQTTLPDKKGNNVTVYHKRPTIVVVLDPYNKYPIGYAIGTHETPELIRQAVRNAITHTDALFGAMYKPYQIQSDHYGHGSMKPFFEDASGKAYVPARVHNAKAKPIEPWWNEINTTYFQLLNNWSGHNITGKTDNQPNAEWKNKIHHSFPDFAGVCKQVETAMEKYRAEKREAYIAGWQRLPADYKTALTTEMFLYRLGETKERSTRMRGEGMAFRIDNAEYCYDSFDMNFRMNMHEDWTARYNPADMKMILVQNKDATKRFLLEEKYAEGSNIAERTEDDYRQYYRIEKHNEDLKKRVVQQMDNDYAVLNGLLQNNPHLNDTLGKMVLVDSMGQYKDRKNEQRTLPAKNRALPIADEKEKPDKNLKKAYEDYLNEKVDLSEYGIY